MTLLPNISSEQELRELLFERSKTAPSILVEPVPADHKWRLASQLQKSIRRNLQSSAIDAALKLHSIDPRYAWFRIGTAALEDIGFGSPVDAAVVLECVRSSDFRRRLGELKCLVACVSGVAGAVKSRSLDDLLCLDPDRKHLPAKAWRAQVEGMDLPFLVRYMAVRGSGYYHFGQLVPGLYERLSASQTTITTNPPDASGEEGIGGQLAASWDRYTREGKIALRSLAKKTGVPDQFDPLCIALFEVEGGFLDRELVWAGGNELRRESYDAQAERAGIDSSQYAELRALIQQQRDRLNRIRRRVVGG